MVKKAKPPPPVRPSVAPQKLLDPFATTEQTKEPQPVAAPVLSPRREVPGIVPRARPLTIQEKKAIEQKKLEEELITEFGGPLKRSLTDDGFDPRADIPPPAVPSVDESPESPEPFNTDDIDPFDTSAVSIPGN